MSAAPGEQGPLDQSSGIFQANSLMLVPSPVFVLMALLTLYYDNARELLCGAVGGTPWNGMATMYLLMCAAHLPPWLKVLSRQRSNARTLPPIRGRR